MASSGQERLPTSSIKRALKKELIGGAIARLKKIKAKSKKKSK